MTAEQPWLFCTLDDFHPTRLLPKKDTIITPLKSPDVQVDAVPATYAEDTGPVAHVM